MKKVLGFTLVELLISVAVIAILTTIGTRVYLSTLENSLDQKRTRDLETLKQTLELYRERNRAYPKALNDLVVGNLISALPTDPKASDNWTYQYQALPVSCTAQANNCASYVLCAKAEGTQSIGYPTDCRNLICFNASGDCNLGIASPEYTGNFINPTPTSIPVR